MNITSSLFDNMFNRNKSKDSREIARLVGKNLWVKASLFNNSPLMSLGSFGNMFGFNGTCWVRLLVSENDYFICNIAKSNSYSDSDDSISSRVEVTKDEIKKILTTKCKLAKSALEIIEPVEVLETGELFEVVIRHNDNVADNDDEDFDDGEIFDDEDEDEEYEPEFDDLVDNRFYENGWPTQEFWENKDFHADDDVWEYLSGPEGEVSDELQVFIEPSTQGRMGSMYIFDESGENRFSSFGVDYGDWLEIEYELACQSNSRERYKELFREYIQGLIDEHLGHFEDDE